MADATESDASGAQDFANRGHEFFSKLGKHISDSLGAFVQAHDAQAAPAPADATAAAAPTPSPGNTTPGADAAAFSTPTGPVGSATPAPPQPQQPTPMPQASPAQAQTAAPTPGTDPLQASQNLANATTAASVHIQQAYDKQMAEYQNFQQLAQKHFADNQAQDAALMHAYQTNQIKPQSVFSGGTASKIGAALGILLSGIGAGMSGQKNMAMEAINEHINRDMEAQKINSQNQYNTYRMHREMSTDQLAADMGFKKDALISLDSQIEQQKMKLLGPTAQANAANAQLDLKSKILDLNMKMAQHAAMQQALSNPAKDGAGQIRQKQLAGLIQPTQAEQAYKELDRVNNLGTEQNTILNSFDKANKENTIGGRLDHLGSTPASVYALQNQLMPYLKDAEGRINETEIKRTDELIPKPGDSPHKINEKRQALQDFLNEKSHSSLLDGIGVKPDVQAPTQTKTMNGKSYKKVPGGWVPE